MNKKILLVSIGTTLLATACKKKECEEWYMGKGCKTEVRTQYIGTYVGTTVDEDGFSHASKIEVTAAGAINELLANGDIKFVLTSSNSGAFKMLPIEISGLRGDSDGIFSGDSLNVRFVYDRGSAYYFDEFSGKRK